MTLKTITATILAATLSTAAFAQSSGGASVGVGVDAGNGNAGASVGATAGANASTDMANQPANFGQIISGLNTEVAADWSTELQGLGEDPQVHIVKLSELKGNAAENASALDNALMKAEADIDAARSAIGGNAKLTAALTAESFTPDDVVAVQVEGDSDVTLIVDDAV